jgi:hypothetical protein
MVPGSEDERRSSRAKVMLAATIEYDGQSIPVRIDDLSSHGAKVLGDRLPGIDTPVTFRCKTLAVSAYVAWVDGAMAGIGFGHPVQPQDVLRKVSAARPVAAQDYRRPGFRGGRLTDAERKIVEGWERPPRERLGE